MRTPVRASARVAISALSVCALSIGLAPSVTAEPIPPNPDIAAVTALGDLINDPATADLLQGLTGVKPDRIAAMRAAPTQTTAAQATAAVTSSPVDASVVSTTDTSATFGFTLPAGQVTRDGAVLQAFTALSEEWQISQLYWLTDPGAGYGPNPVSSYDEQLAGIELRAMLRENFTLTGATAETGRSQDELVVPAGSNSFEITVSSSRTKAELEDAIRSIIGDQPAEDGSDSVELLTDVIWSTRLALPEADAWTYGDRLGVQNPAFPLPPYPNGADELSATRTGTTADSTLTVTRADDTAFSGDRVLELDQMAGMFDLFLFQNAMLPPPLRGERAIQVSGATAVRDGFYLPEPGTDVVSARSTMSGPQDVDEARALYEDWVINTCEAELSDPIFEDPAAEGEVITWDSYFDSTASDFDEAEIDETDVAVLYTGPEYIDAVADYREMMFDEITVDVDLEEISEQSAAYWDAACGTSTDDPDDPELGTPATVAVDVPDAGTVGSPITLSATVTDADGQPVSGQDVTFTIVEEGGEPVEVAAFATAPSIATTGATTLTATTDDDGVAQVEFTPTTTGNLRVSASTGGADPVVSETDSTVTISPDADDGDDDDSDDDGGSPGGTGSLGSLFGSLGN